MTSPQVAICVATFRRELPLRRLLRSLDEAERPPGHRVVVVVVDNHPTPFVDADSLRASTSLPIEVVHEARPGISHARNAAVRWALGTGADWLAFVDDDESVSSTWLTCLLAEARRSRAALVAGPVLSCWPEGTEASIVEAGFLARRRHPTGTTLQRAATGNLLVAAHVFADTQPWFDPRFALTGGEDTDFTIRAITSGARATWCDEAEVWEHVEPERATWEWIASTRLRTGTQIARREQEAGRTLWVLRTALRQAATGALGLVASRPDAVRRHELILRLHYARGLVLGLLGRQHAQYARRNSNDTAGGRDGQP